MVRPFFNFVVIAADRMSKMKPFTKEGDKTGPNDSAGSYSLFVYCRASTQQIPYLKDV